jgi:predicted nuclease of restriction endonuclease-like (RecB) superfamily
VSAKLYIKDLQQVVILRTATAKLLSIEDKAIENYQNTDFPILQSVTGKSQIEVDKLIHQLSFSHFIEFLKADTPIKRSFYEMEAIKNAWSVRQLQRAMNSMLYERTGLSSDKQAVLDKQVTQERLLPEEVFRNPYILEFLGLKEEAEYSESQLEQAIIDHLQTFLLELGKGFCFEARQKRITFDNTHYRIDLVFYHRVLKCNVLIDPKLGEFTHADAGQMNVYLNYYKENETYEGDNPPIGIILCASKNESLVKYATTGLPQQVFVNKYMISLPQEAELRKIIEEEQQKIMGKD